MIRPRSRAAWCPSRTHDRRLCGIADRQGDPYARIRLARPPAEAAVHGSDAAPAAGREGARQTRLSQEPCQWFLVTHFRLGSTAQPSRTEAYPLASGLPTPGRSTRTLA